MATPTGIMPASVHIEGGLIVAVAGYEEIPREADAEELGKSVLMPALRDLSSPQQPATSPDGIEAASRRLAETWTEMRNQGQAIEGISETLCHGQISAGSAADFIVWNPELVVIGTRPVLYGQLRKVIVGGERVY